MEVYNMAKFTLDALRNSIAELFEKAEDQETIKKYAVVENELNKAQDALQQQEEKEKELLKDLREAYIHSSIKPEPGKTAEQDIGASSSFNSNELIASFMETHNADGSIKK